MTKPSIVSISLQIRQNKLECLIFEMLFIQIQQKRPKLNTQADSIRAKLKFTPIMLHIYTTYFSQFYSCINNYVNFFTFHIWWWWYEVVETSCNFAFIVNFLILHLLEKKALARKRGYTNGRRAIVHLSTEYMHSKQIKKHII